MSKQHKIIIGSIIGVIIIIFAISFGVSNLKNKNTVEISGIIETDNTEVPSLVSGVVDEVAVTEGKTVKKGDILLKLDTKQLQIKKEQAESFVKQAEAQYEMVEEGASSAEIRQLQAKVNQAKANLQTVSAGAKPEEIAQAKAQVETLQVAYNQAEKQFESSKKLHEQDIIPKNKLEAAELAYNNAKAALTSAQETLKLLKKGADAGQRNLAKQRVAESQAALSQIKNGARPAQLKTAEAQVDQAKSQLKLIQQMIDDSSIKAPINGTVSEIAASDGELVTKGSSIASLIDLEHLWIKVFVPESKLVFINTDQPAQIYPDAVKDISFPGKVAYIAQKGAFVPAGTKESNDQQVFEVKVALEKTLIDKIQLRPGMSVKVKIDTSK